MVIDVHKKCGHDPLPPRMVAESLPQGMAADHPFQIAGIGIFLDDPECLYPRDRASFVAAALKKELVRAYPSLFLFYIILIIHQCLFHIPVDKDQGSLVRFLF